MKSFTKSNFNYAPFLDILFNFLLVFIAIFLLIKIKSDKDPSVSPNVVYQIIMDWDGKSKSDVDLWVVDPQDHTVSFKSREGGEGSLCSLARDDLGKRGDVFNKDKVIEVNQEIISIRGLVPGEYIVNCHYYKKEEKLPERITAKLVKIKPFKVVISTEKVLLKDGDEKTFFRFRVDADNNIIETNELPAIITQAKQEGPSEQ